MIEIYFEIQVFYLNYCFFMFSNPLNESKC